MKYDDVAHQAEVFDRCYDLAFEAGGRRDKAIDLAGQAVYAYRDHVGTMKELNYDNCSYVARKVIQFVTERVEDMLKED